jgi:hypothetical protein
MFDVNDDGDGREPWRSDDAAELNFGDPDAWRGAPEPCLDPCRADVLEHGWPAADAGPEYKMWKERERNG